VTSRAQFSSPSSGGSTPLFSMATPWGGPWIPLDSLGINYLFIAGKVNCTKNELFRLTFAERIVHSEVRSLRKIQRKLGLSKKSPVILKVKLNSTRQPGAHFVNSLMWYTIKTLLSRYCNSSADRIASLETHEALGFSVFPGVTMTSTVTSIHAETA